MKKLMNFSVYAMLALALVLTLFPFLWMVSTAFKPIKQTFRYPPQWIPEPATIDNFIRIWSQSPFPKYIENTILVTGLILLGQLFFGALAAYSFSRLKYPGRDIIFLLFLGSLMIPDIITMIPQYIIMKKLDWINTFKSIIIPQFFGNAFGVFLLRQFFMTIPKDLEEAAKIDGLGIARTFFWIIVPISRPVMATLSVIVFVKSWNNFLWPLITLSSPDKYVISIGLANLMGQFNSDWAGVMAAACITLLPILILFAFTQRYFIQSIHMSGLK